MFRNNNNNNNRNNIKYLYCAKMLRLTAGSGLILKSPARRSTMANLNVGIEQGIGSNLPLKQRLRHGKQ